MKKHAISSRLTILVMILCLLMSGVSVYGASSSVKVSGQTVPKTITQGSSFNIKGKISSNQRIKRVEIGVTSSSGLRWTAQKYDNKNVNAKSFDIKKADSKVSFGKLKAGTYIYRIYVHTADKKVHCVINEKFTVKAKSSGAVTASCSGCNYPTTLQEGTSFIIQGKAKASAKIQKIEVGVVNKSTGKWTAQKYTESSLGKKTFNVAKADPSIKFGQLPAGTYYYRIVVKTGNKSITVLDREFTVETAAAPTTDVPAEPTLGGSVVKTKGCNSPGNYNVGKSFRVKGTVSSEDVINMVEVGIVVDPTNKWSEYKYTASVGAKSFDLSYAADSLKFDMLPGGDFRYRMYVHTDKGVTIVFDKKFTVKPSGRPKAAIAWATNIANDNTYSYGRGYGGYFTCCVCKNKTKKKEAQFTCMPFLAAAYAHATGFDDLMGNGRHVMNLNNDNFKGTLGKYWFKVGLCRDLTIDDLQPGDVVVKYAENNSSGHVWMYGGGDTIIEAVPSDIRVLATGAAVKLGRYGTNEGSPSKNYVMRFRK